MSLCITLTKPSTVDKILSQRQITVAIAALVTLSFVASPVFGQIDTGSVIGSPDASSPQNNSTSLSNNTATAATNNTSILNSTTPNQPQNNSTSAPNSTTTSNAANTTMLNLGMPSFIEHNIGTNETNVNENTTRITFVGAGMLILPGGNVTTTDHGKAVIYSTQGYSRAYGHVTLRTPDGNQNATVTFVEFLPSNSTVGIGTAYIESNSTGQLGALDGTIGVFRDEMHSNTSTITFWKWSE